MFTRMRQGRSVGQADWRRLWFLLGTVLASVIAVSNSPAASWPCFHGAKRDNHSLDTGLLQVWPEAGPPLLWTASGIGHGYSSVVVAEQRVVTAGMIGKQTHVTALDMSGKGSLTYAEGRLYCLDEKGVMSLVSASPGQWKEVSSFRVPRGGRGAYWAHPVVCGGRLYVRHGEQLYAYNIREGEAGK